MDRIPSGIEGFDEIIGGGLPRFRTFLVSGSCGTGKTIFGAQFIKKGFESGEPCLYITFEQSKKKLIEDLKEIGIDFQRMGKGKTFHLVGGPIGHVKYFKEKARAKVMDIVSEVEEIITDTKARRVVIDSVNLFTMLFENDIERRRALAELTFRLEQLDCTTLLTCEIPEASTGVSWHGFEEFVVDGVILLRRIPFENMFERAVSVIKMRGINHTKNMHTFRIDGKGIRVFPDQEPFHKAQ